MPFYGKSDSKTIDIFSFDSLPSISTEFENIINNDLNVFEDFICLVGTQGRIESIRVEKQIQVFGKLTGGLPAFR